MKAKEMTDMSHTEINLVPPDIMHTPYSNVESDIKIGDSNLKKSLEEAIVKASNVFIKSLNGDCLLIAKELKGALQKQCPGVWVCAVSKGVMGATTSVNKGREMFFKIGDYRFFITQLSNPKLK